MERFLPAPRTLSSTLINALRSLLLTDWGASTSAEVGGICASYTNVIQLQGDAMRDDSEAMQRAYQQVAAEFAMEQHSANNKMGASFVLADLNEYARRSNTTPTLLKTSGFVQVLIRFVIGELDNNDREWVLARAAQILSPDPNRPIPAFAPAVCTLRPDNAATLRVTSRDIAHWRSNPEDLVGKCFVTNEEIMKRTLLVQDYYVKRAGPRFDVVFEDTGLDPEAVNILDTDELLTIIENAELITNM